MKHDDLFRLIICGLVLVFMPIGLYHRIRSYTGEKLDRWQEGAFILFGLRLTGLAIFGGGIAWMIQPRWMAWSSLPLPLWLRWAGLFLMGCGGVLFSWAVHSLGKNLTDTVVTRNDHWLVTTGPYRWVRHPFYTACATGFLGFSLVTANWYFFLTGAIGFAFLVARTSIEEQKLIERFGDKYRTFMATRGRFLPRLGG